MEAPEKIYIHPDIGDREFLRPWLHRAVNNESVEYSRTDVFIEKACKFIKERLFFEDSWHVEGENCILDKVIEDFKSYMKGE